MKSLIMRWRSSKGIRWDSRAHAFMDAWEVWVRHPTSIFQLSIIIRDSHGRMWAVGGCCSAFSLSCRQSSVQNYSGPIADWIWLPLATYCYLIENEVTTYSCVACGILFSS